MEDNILSGRRILVLGIGNLLWADEGFGVRAVEAFGRAYEYPNSVLLMDGGTQGLLLMPHIQEATHLLIFDAVDFGQPPGTMVTRRNEEVPAYLHSGKMSLHQTGFQEVLVLCDLLGSRPPEMALIGLQPLDWDTFGGDLTTLARESIPTALESAVSVLREWGVEPRLRREGACGEFLFPRALQSSV
ncbi:MAG: HyaD/HybD family hydrogenase maturation endopeptidase [Nitrospirae bacterium]|nr:HyaD/HybD family hydrogenase maturation endopeptidase [Nitrospirota bacterium]